MLPTRRTSFPVHETVRNWTPCCTQALLGIANQPKLGTAYVGPYALAPLPAQKKAASATAQLFGRLDLVHGLLSTYGMNGACEGMAVPEVMGLAKQGLEMADDKVRSSAPYIAC